MRFLVLALSACTANLSVPTTDAISCASDKQCPENSSCKAGRCQSNTSNGAPSGTVSGVPARPLTTVDFTLTASDAEGDPSTLRAEYSLNPSAASPTWVAATVTSADGASLTTSPTGVAHAMTWNAIADADLATPGGLTSVDVSSAVDDSASVHVVSGQSAVALRLTLDDGKSHSQGLVANVSPAFALGNRAPLVALNAFSGTASGPLELDFSPRDADGDAASIAVVFRASNATPTEPWRTAAISFGDTSALATPGNYAILWNTSAPTNNDPTQAQGVGSDNLSVDVKVRAFDMPGGAPAEYGVWSAAESVNVHDKNLPPVATLVKAPTGTLGGEIPLKYTLSDAENDTASVLVEVFDGTSWQAAEQGDGGDPSVGLRTQSSPTYTFVWNSTQLGFATYGGILLRLTPYDSEAGATVAMTTAFAVDNTAVVNGAPTVTITNVQSPEGGRPMSDVAVGFVVSDPNGASLPVADTVTVTPQFWNGSTWQTATVSAGTLTNLTAPPSGDAYQFTWNALADLPSIGVDTDGNPATLDATILQPLAAQMFRLQATDSGTPPAHNTSPATTFAAGNTAPLATLSTLSGALSGEIAVQFTVADAQSDLADVQLQFRQNASDAWRTAAIALGTQTALSTTPTGSVYVLVWDSTQSLNADPAQPQGSGTQNLADLEIRVRALDSPGAAGTDYYGAWSTQTGLTLVNQTPPEIAQLIARRPQLSAGAGVVDVYFTLADAQSDPADVQIEFTGDDGATWTPCNEFPSLLSGGRQGLATSPSGVRHAFLWDVSSSVFRVPSAALLRVRAADASGIGDWSETTLPRTLWPSDRSNGFGALHQGGSDGCNHDRIAILDFTGDGAPDWFYLASACSTNTVGVAVMATSGGKPTGSRDHTDLFAIGTNIVDGVPVDFNGDGVPDVALASSTAGLVTALANTSSGTWAETFASANTYASGTTCRSVATGDISGDGAPDAVIACDGNVYVWTQSVASGEGTGAFTAGTTQNLGATLVSVKLADVDGDGALDIIAADSGNSGAIWVARGHNNGNFDAATMTPVGAIPKSITAADLNGDGFADIVSANYAAGTLSVFLSNGDGTLQNAESYDVDGNPNQVAVGDTNGDGYLDLVAATDDNNTGIATLLGYADGYARGAGAFFPFSVVSDIANHKSIALADFNGDGVVDEVSANASSFQNFTWFFGQGIGSGFSFGDELLFSSANVDDYSDGNAGADQELSLADVDGDGALDLVVFDGSAYIYSGTSQSFGTPDGTFAGSTQVSLNDTSPFASGVVADLNGDGIFDIAACPNSQMSVRLGTAATSDLWSGAFGADTAYSAGSGSTSDGSAFGDINGDGFADIVFWTTRDGVFFDLSQTTSGAFSGYRSSQQVTNTGTSGAAIGDLNQDGYADVVDAGGYSGYGFSGTRVSLANGSGGFGGQTSYGNDTSLQRVRVADFTGDGVPDVVVSRADIDPDDGDSSSYLLLWPNQTSARKGTGTLGSAVKTNISTSGPMAVGDFNHDGFNDLAVIDDPYLRDGSGTAYVRFLTANTNNGAPTGTFTDFYDVPIAANPRAVAVSDLNDDGMLDVVVAFSDTNTGGATLGEGAAVIFGNDDGATAWAHSAPFASTVPTTGAALFGVSPSTATTKDNFGGNVSGIIAVQADSDPAHALFSVGTTPITQTLRVEGDARITSVPVQNGSYNDTRMRVESRYGAPSGVSGDFGRGGLTIAAGEGFVFEMPISAAQLSAVQSGGTVTVLRNARDFRRADSDPLDPLYGTSDAHRYLPCRTAGGVCASTIYQPEWTQSSLTQTSDATLATPAVERFYVDKTRGVIRLCVQSLGLFRAFIQ